MSDLTVADLASASNRGAVDGAEETEVSFADTSMETTAPANPLASTVTTHKGPLIIRYSGSFTIRGTSGSSSAQVTTGPSIYVRSVTTRGNSLGSSAATSAGTSVTARAAGSLAAAGFSGATATISGAEGKRQIKEVKRKKKMLCGVC
jgi:hypothetical protein